MTKVYFEWYLGVFFLVGASGTYWFADSPDYHTQCLLIMSAICLGVNSIKQFIAENKGEVNDK